MVEGETFQPKVVGVCLRPVGLVRDTFAQFWLKKIIIYLPIVWNTSKLQLLSYETRMLFQQ